jgi:hypothetical protein
MPKRLMNYESCACSFNVSSSSDLAGYFLLSTGPVLGVRPGDAARLTFSVDMLPLTLWQLLTP